MFAPDGPSFWELARQALSSTEHGYDLLAPKFDATPFRTPDEVIARVVQHIGEPVDSALDLCTGTGAALPHLASRCRRRLVGIDFSEGMLEQARARMATQPFDGDLELVRGDVLDLPFEAELDVVTCFGAFGHIVERDEPRFVAQIAKALRPGGRFLFATSELPSWRSPGLWVARGFNAAMRVRNALLRPEFVMYYLTFAWPDCGRLLEDHGFEVRCHPAQLEPPYHHMLVIDAMLKLN
jgi:ubiquinone/menaquinone biosynthesis C-methylase UbiE